MFGKYKQQNKLSYLIGFIFIVIIFSTIGAKVTAIVEKNKNRQYISTSAEDLFSKEKNNLSYIEAKKNMVRFYEMNQGKYVKWTLKAQEVNGFFDTVRCPVSMKVIGDSNLFIKCKFDNAIEDKIKKGQMITVSGQITGYSEFSKAIELKNCRIEK